MDMAWTFIYVYLIFHLLFIFTTSVQVWPSGEYDVRFLDKQDGVFQQRVRRQSGFAKPVLEVTDFHVRSTVVSRYARTTVTSSVWNQLHHAEEATFEVDLPSSAFISNFTITSDGKVYVARVKEKGVAKKIYDAAKKKGKTAGLVATKEREAERFSVAVSVPPGSRLSLALSYEELLSRRLGRYELVLGLRPTQPVQNLSVEVTVSERTGISFIRVLPLRTSRLLTNTLGGETEAPPSTQIEQAWPHSARVHYSPTVEQQTSSSLTGLSADFVIQYDVEITDLIGDVQIYDGYFVHYFAPRGLPVVPKEVIFVIDVSGSMSGTKIKQTKQAMDTILGDLREHDHFNIITFSSHVRSWQQGGTVPATQENIRLAKAFVKSISSHGTTDINGALLGAAELLRPASTRTGARGVPLVIFLTDGEASAGVTARGAILANAREALGTASLFGLAFGDDADFGLLRQLSLENRGVARKVYEDADAKLQLKGFYDEVASPLLADIQLGYRDDQAFDVTRSRFPNYFQGSELVVAGRVRPGVRDLAVSLAASDTRRDLRLGNSIPVSEGGHAPPGGSSPAQEEAGEVSGFVRRLWAYFTIKELLQSAQNSSDPASRSLLEQRATNLSLKYNFVTPVTSLVVVKPDIEEKEPGSVPAPGNTTTQTADLAVFEPDLGPSKDSPLKPQSRKNVFTSSVDGDPHFVVHLPKLDQTLCFTIDGRANDVVRLLEDSERGITVDGRLMWAPPEVGFEDQVRTYFDRITISVVTDGAGEVVVTVTLNSVEVDVKGEGLETLRPDRPGSVRRRGLVVEIDELLRCWVDLGRGVLFLVLSHHYRHPTYLQLAHLGFYTADGSGLSQSTGGLLGQFQHADIEITPTRSRTEAGRPRGARESRTEGVLRRGAARVPVALKRKQLKDTVRKRHPGQCWQVAKGDVEKILSRPYQSYVQ